MRKAFTLIELLVAVAIFSFALVIAASVFSNVVGAQSYVGASVEVNKESERIIRQISDDTINAIGIGAVTNPGLGTIDAAKVPHGIMFLKSNKPVTPDISCQDPKVSGCSYNGVVLFAKDSLKIYRFNSSDKTIEYATGTSATLSIAANGEINNSYNFSTLNNSKVEIISDGFYGIACYKNDFTGVCRLSPYLGIDFTTETKNYDNQAARHRSKLELKTIVSSRSY